MKKERIISAVNQMTAFDKAVLAAAEEAGDTKGIKEWNRLGCPFPYSYKGKVWEMEMAEADGVRAFHLRDTRPDGIDESLAMKDGIIAIESHSADRREWPVTDHPMIFQWLLDRGYLPGTDGPLFICRDRKPLEVDEYQMLDFSGYMTGKKRTAMPIVYLSLSYYTGKPLVDPVALQEKLRGIAHVVYPEAGAASDVLRRAMKDENGKDHAPFNGAAEVIISERNRCRFPFQTYQDPEKAVYPLLRVIRQRLLTDASYAELSWNAVAKHSVKEENKALKGMTEELRQAIEKLKANARTASDAEIDKIFDQLSDELKEERERRIKAEDELKRVKAIIESKESNGNPDSLSLSIKEQEMYPGEFLDTVLTMLEKRFQSLKAGDPEIGKTRMGTILQSIMDSNEKNGTGERIADELKRIIEPERMLSDSAIGKLRKLGFEEKPSSDGKHAKYLFRGDERYPLSLSVTPSDRYSRTNEAQRIRRLLFPW